MIILSRYFLLTAFLFTLAAPALAETVIGQSCPQLGASMMTTDQKDIATCLKDDTGNLVWKGMTTSGDTGTVCGLSFYASDGASHGGSSCKGVNVKYSNCPTGYTKVMGQFDTGKIGYFVFCVKN